ncbi:hypothetical protein [Necropsobacter massiliensis]|uniref:hypothetical protein n=1 Tax=Necropsobacter massiliensis TaxID=1400001 RepID=UPI0005960377|nr:hypothetical protein [Necropsobacter massiliensis]
MKMTLQEEKELLRLKGEILRLKFRSQTASVKQEVYQPIQHFNALRSSLLQPVIRSLCLNLLSRRLLTPRNVLFSGMAVALVGLLGKPRSPDH